MNNWLPELSEQAIEEFADIYRQRYQIELRHEQAKIRAQQVMSLLMVLFQPTRRAK
jgi:hypothetical protein